ncbi:MAG TPA: alginate lyase family protein, partial [Candidatus Polarisedimenticolia bacterium]|nr:alginate lyase family protein [Candidatus Polarisedimenticolia bacterium]
MKFRTLGGRAAAALALGGALGTAGVAQQFTISSTSFDIGGTGTVSMNGPARSLYFLLFDTVPGSWVLPGGAWLGLGLSGNFGVIDRGALSSSGTAAFSATVPNDPSLIGFTFYLQLAGLPAGAVYFDTSNLLTEVVGSGGGSIVGFHPDDGGAVDPACRFEIRTDATLQDSTVNSNNVVLTNGAGKTLAATLTLKEGGASASIVVAPNTVLIQGDRVTLTVKPGLRTDGGQSLGGPQSASWSVATRPHPVLFNSKDEVDLYRQRINAGTSPWKSAWDILKQEADSKAMGHKASPTSGPPPSDWNSFLKFYNNWFLDSRYAQDLAWAWQITGDSKYGNKSRELIMAWMVFDPTRVGPWYWAIQYDIATVSYACAVDILWDYPGLSGADRNALRNFFNDLVGVIQNYQNDVSNTKPENIRSWNNTAIASLGVLLERPYLANWAIQRNSGNPFSFYQMLDDAMAADGRMYDAYRGGGSNPYEGVTYPAYHLHAWSMLSEIALHNDLGDLYHARNQYGVDQLKGWQYLIPYLDGTYYTPGLTDRIKRDFCISKYYQIQKIHRRTDVDSLFNLYGGEPQYETHVFKKGASFTHNLPSSLLKPDTTPPGTPRSLAAVSVGSVTVSLTWTAPTY